MEDNAFMSYYEFYTFVANISNRCTRCFRAIGWCLSWWTALRVAGSQFLWGAAEGVSVGGQL